MMLAVRRSLSTTIGTAALAIVGALAVGAVLVGLSGSSPWSALTGLVDGAFGTRYHLGETVVRATPLAIVALGVAPALRAGIFTVGSEGQLAMGAAASTAAILAVGDGPAVVLILVGVLFGAIGGAAWAFLPAILRARLRVNEILSTLMLNYLAASLLLWLLKHPLKNSQTVATPRSDNLPKAALVPNLLDGTRLHWGVLVVVIGALALAWWVRSLPGFAYDVFGARPALGARMGVSETKAVISTMLVAGAAAGMAGWLQVAGLQGTLYTSVAGGLGFTGVVVAILGDLKPAGVVAAALVFGALATGADGLQVGTGVPASIATVLSGILLVAAALVFAARQRRVRSRIVVDTDEPASPVITSTEAPAPR